MYDSSNQYPACHWQDYNRRLREEQDAEYQRSLAEDRERERKREEAAQAKLAAQRALEEAAAKEQ